MGEKTVSLARLFGVCFCLSALTVGGGYVIVGLMQKRLVEDLGWLGRDEMLDLIAIAQSSPGAIAVNAANLVGWKLRGAAGAAVAIIGSLLPPMAIIVAVGFFYLEFRDNEIVSNVLKGMTAGVTAVILDVVTGLLGQLFKARRIVPLVVCFAAFAVAFFAEVNVALILIAAGVFGALHFGRAKMDRVS